MTDYKSRFKKIPVIRDRYARIAQYASEGISSYSMFAPDEDAETLIDQEYEGGTLNQSTEMLMERIAKLDGDGGRMTIAGRARLVRNGGKIAFIKIDTGVSAADSHKSLPTFIQAVGQRELTPLFAKFRKLHIGDIISVSGFVKKTDAGEASIFVDDWQFLTKNIRPLPDKVNGITNVEQRYRHRCVDLISNEEARRTLVVRSLVLRNIRDVLHEANFIEVETPTLHETKGGAAAAAFGTHYNALDQDVLLRIAPELYLKRLVVGGMNRVYEIGKNFRNEGLDRTHNPEFTSVEFYAAYWDYEDLIDLCSKLLNGCRHTCSTTNFPTWNGHRVNLLPWGEGEPCTGLNYERATMIDLISRETGINHEQLFDEKFVLEHVNETCEEDFSDWGKALLLLFEQHVEHTLINPTFVTEYPASVSPLARPCDHDPRFVDRFELFVAGVELANGFNELANPETQYERFSEQIAAKEAGDGEAMDMDLNYITALEYGLPPTAGCGIGIDRLVMLLTQNDSIKEVIAFPHLKPEAE